MHAILVDTSAWIALIHERDQYHTRAVAVRGMMDRETHLVITWAILSETYTFLRYRAGFPVAQRWLHTAGISVLQGTMEVVYPSMDLEPVIQSVLARFAEHDLSYTDALSLGLLQRRPDIDAVFAFDRHMRLSGLQVLPS
jgi:predicted nucleic acid-binding protein